MVVTHGALTGRSPRVPPGNLRGWALTIGNFDGVHRGHRALLDRVMARGRERHLGSCVLTFEPHPREFFAAASGKPEVPARITRLRDKLELMAEVGIERVHVARFDAQLASLPAAAFVEDVLVRGMDTRWLIVGRDFHYGKGRAGDFPALEGAASQLGFRVEAMPDVEEAGGRVSSSAVRAALAAGDFSTARRLLGRDYSISGRVAHGAGLGRELGCATANIVLRRSPPLSGIYVVEAEIEEEEGGRKRRGARHPGVASVGRRPTVNPLPRPLLEVHLLDLDRDLYGKHLRVTFLEKLREEAKYGGLDELKHAIAGDVARAREYFLKRG